MKFTKKMKIHPHRVNTKLNLQSPPPQPPPRHCYDPSTSRETFTLWFKSLILGGNGCTVFDSKGRVAYRVDNYASKCCNQVFLMDCHGNVVLTILRKKFRLLSTWEGYRHDNNGTLQLFRITKCWKITQKSSKYQVIVNLDQDSASSYLFMIEKGKNNLSSCRIVDKSGGLVAEIKRKESGGVILGDDVLTLTVESNVNHCLIMGLMIVYSLVHCI